ncbi:MAG: trimethylamine methyltransferase family protein [Planctomycetota bacterium]
MNRRYKLTGGLTDKDMEIFHERVLHTIEKIGAKISSKLAESLAGRKNFSVSGNKTTISAAVVEDYLARVRQRPVPDSSLSSAYSIVAPGALPFYLEDVETSQLRPLLTADAVSCCKLIDGLSEYGLKGQAAGMPQDIPIPLRMIASCKIGLENCRTAGAVGVTSLAEAQIMDDMLDAVGKSGRTVNVFVLNPLRVEGNEVDIALNFIEKNPSVNIYVHSMPIQGLSVPVHLAGAFVEAAAAVIAGATIFDQLTQGDVTFDISTVFQLDMKTGAIVYGTPQFLLSMLIGKGINEFYGIHNPHFRSLTCNMAACDAQSTSLRSMQTVYGALSDFTEFCYGGLLAVDKVFSPLQLLVDVEIVKYAESVANGFGFESQHLSFDAINEIGTDGDYLTHPTTLADYRQIGWNTILFGGESLEQYTKDPRQLRKKARALIDEKIKNHDFSLPDEIQKELDSIYKRACKVLMKDS